jgi:branched-chain amino acid transport system substrate-binding protein
MLDAADAASANDAQKLYYGSLKSAGLDTDYISGLVWDPAMILISAIRALGPTADPTQIRDYIDRQRAFRGIAGSFDFTDGSQRGLSQKDMMVMRWDQAKGTWQPASRLGGALLR